MRACIPVSVNVPAAQPGAGDLAGRTEALLAAAGLPGSLRCVEVTESGLLQDPDLAAATLGRLRALGVRIAVDDLGTGCSSLSHLQRLSLDVLKVDRSFVFRIEADEASAKVVRSLVERLRLVKVAVELVWRSVGE